MHIIHVEFVRFSEVHVSDLFRRVGVYVLWDGRACGRPRYIGEGGILNRLADHDNKWLINPVDGYIGFLNANSNQKRDARIVERILLQISKETDRAPTHNAHPGIDSEIRKLSRCHGQIRVSVNGYDPLLPPFGAKRLFRAKVASLWLQNEDWCWDGPWKQRRIQRCS
jgi:hypothetical protein